MEDCTNCQKEHTFRLEKIEKKLEERERIILEQAIKIEKIDESLKSVNSRINEIGEQTLAIYKLGVAVENMAEQLKEFTSNFKEHEDRIDKLERIPGDNAYDIQKQIKIYILIALVGVILGGIFSKFGVKI